MAKKPPFNNRVWNYLSSTLQEFADVLSAYLPTPTPPEPAYKVYTALLTQSGTNAPVATVLENTLGLNPTYFYSSSGNYYLEDLAGLFIANKTAVFMQFKNGGPTFEIWVENVNQIYVGTDSQDDNLLNTFIEIRVYN